MVNIKEIKSVNITPFTLMTATINAVLAFIAAIVYLILFGIVGAFLPNFGASLALLGVALIIILPISAFFIGLTTNFFSAFLYNGLVSRVGGVKLGLDGSDLTEIPVVSFSLILAVIEAIWAFIIGLFLAALVVPFASFMSSAIPLISQEIANASNMTGTTVPTGSAVGVAGAVGALILIIGLPITVFIVGFIGHALTAIFYNYIATKAAKIKLEFAAIAESLHELKSIPVVPAALAVSIVMAIWGLIFGIISLIGLSAQGYALSGVITLVSDIVRNFIMYFIITALVAIIYNYLAPKIGGIKLNLE
ncbi:MAG: hypothetical protein ACP5OJ_03100 [Methanothermobacter sp.]